jgi:predicted alpha-1,6-mannanase (GH76 family)
MNSPARWTSLLLLSLIAAAPASVPSTTAQHGADILAHIQSAFYMPQRSLYAEQVRNGKKPGPAWTWDASIQLGALCSAARMQPRTYQQQVHAYAVALRSYRTTNHNLPGLDVNPAPKPPDRYYDDNAWICLSLLEAYQLTHDPGDLALAKDAYHFACSGEDLKTLDGGIYWHEDQTKSKNACSSGPTMLAALALYDLTKDRQYLATAQRLYDWTRAHLQDEDGLVYDNIEPATGKINKVKLTYNTGTLIRAACHLYRVTNDQAYLDEAKRVAAASEKRFVRPKDGLIPGPGKLSVKLFEAYLEMYDTTHDEHWRDVCARCLTALLEHRSTDGFYPTEWQQPAPAPGSSIRLIDQAAPARAFWMAAERGVEMK